MGTLQPHTLSPMAMSKGRHINKCTRGKGRQVLTSLLGATVVLWLVG